MNGHPSKAPLAGRRATLNSLKDELDSLNMRLLPAIQHHNDNSQMTAVQDGNDRMCFDQ